jgi:hypothetical protein
MCLSYIWRFLKNDTYEEIKERILQVSIKSIDYKDHNPRMAATDFHWEWEEDALQIYTIEELYSHDVSRLNIRKKVHNWRMTAEAITTEQSVSTRSHPLHGYCN